MDAILLALIAALLLVRIVYDEARADNESDLVILTFIGLLLMIPVLVVAAIFLAGAYGLHALAASFNLPI